MADEQTLRDRLRTLPVFGDDLPPFDTDAVPDDPIDLFLEWLTAALDAEVSQPHTMVLATSDPSGHPSARTLLLKDVTPTVEDEPGAVWFAAMSDSPKGVELEANPRAALMFYWREQGRQVRISGPVFHGDREVSERDFLARHPAARATVLAGDQSAPMPPVDEVDRAVASAKEFISVNPNFVPETWRSYFVQPLMVEFWQAARHSEQKRLQYTSSPSGGWERRMLWP
ncbi:pyridoxine/pyridoxamine 5'-phosphate oxidase [Planctomonas psychrotolerans]|uniref:pyridoxine/pyridoxamine 5'-phosphate oxidase n=1 Tax=Planctomonas psychrotolerans TaxID=2528712 RepID=UPI00123C79A4|nr:pyridoxal 5'-phosphate synthase [Planctomonas psychrotolerans]